ncbi:MAG: Rne/Rng family ribonuclease, partial [Nitrospina sp.]|nr:Rne/Rng family ribonuclease [Nitrospina sp.]
MYSEILINSNQREIRVALMENNQVSELFIEHKANKGIVGNIYRGKVTKILPGMQVAFVDIGLEKAGFLYVGDIDVIDMLGIEEEIDVPPLHDEKEDPFNGKPGRPNHDINIQDILQEGQEILVQ